MNFMYRIWTQGALPLLAFSLLRCPWFLHSEQARQRVANKLDKVCLDSIFVGEGFRNTKKGLMVARSSPTCQSTGLS